MDTERKIEKLLRAFAKKRRDQAPDPSGLELHPATRRLLQSEVARRGQKPVEGNFFLKLFLLLRPRLALVVGVAVIAFVAASLLRTPSGSGRKEMAARQESLKKSPAKEPSAPPPAPVTVASDSQRAKSVSPDTFSSGGAPAANAPQPPTLAAAKSETGVSFRDSAVVVESLSQLKDQVPELTNRLTLAEGTPVRTYSFAAGAAGDEQAAASKADSLTPVPAETKTLAMNEGMSLDSAKQARPEESDRAASGFRELTVGAIAPGSPPAGPAAALLFKNGATNAVIAGRDVVSRRFSRLDVDGQNKPGTIAGAAETAPVLANFEVEQNGGQIRIVDADGSVYSGYLELTDAEAPPPAVATPAASTAVSRARSAPEGRAEQVPARRENAQNYSFRVAGTNRSLNQNVVFTGNLLNETNQGSPYQLRLENNLDLNSRISGRAVIDGRREIEINAAPAAP